VSESSGPAGRGVEELFPKVYDQLHRLATRMRPTDSVTPTVLVHEAYLRLVRQGGADAWTEQKVRAIGASAMRSVLVDLARRRGAQKRGGDQQRVTLSGVGSSDRVLDVLALHRALEQLEDADEEAARIVELRFFGGLTNDEVAAELGVPLRRVERRWRSARALLRHLLEEQ
jgi:RNA polymerase sigma factor (TIGR02999 family)